MGLVYYLKKTSFTIKNPPNVGKYTSPMDPIWWFQPEKYAVKLDHFP